MNLPFVKGKPMLEDFGSCIMIINGRLELNDIESQCDGTITCNGLVLPLTDGVEYFSSNGERFLVYYMSLGAKIEAEAIRKIRESEVIKGLFETPEPKRFMDYLPMVILGLVALFSIILRK